MLNSAMLLLPPPVSARSRLAAIARRRGISITIIAQVLGVSRQAIDQSIARFERYYGSVSTPLKTHLRKRATSRFLVCAGCGKNFLRKSDQHLTIHCSAACMGKEMRLLTKSEVAWAIDQRTVNSQTWTSIAQILGTDIQTVQSGVWLRLIEENNLMENVVEKIWRGDQPRLGRPGNWEWLIKRTGVSPNDLP